MNSYKDWMMALYTNRMMNGKSGIPDARSLLARKKLPVEQKGAQRKRNERRLALALAGGRGHKNSGS